MSAVVMTENDPKSSSDLDAQTARLKEAGLLPKEALELDWEVLRPNDPVTTGLPGKPTSAWALGLVEHRDVEVRP